MTHADTHAVVCRKKIGNTHFIHTLQKATEIYNTFSKSESLTGINVSFTIHKNNVVQSCILTAKNGLQFHGGNRRLGAKNGTEFVSRSRVECRPPTF